MTQDEPAEGYFSHMGVVGSGCFHTEDTEADTEAQTDLSGVASSLLFFLLICAWERNKNCAHALKHAFPKSCAVPLLQPSGLCRWVGRFPVR